MTLKSCKYGKCGSFERLLFLLFPLVHKDLIYVHMARHTNQICYESQVVTTKTKGSGFISSLVDYLRQCEKIFNYVTFVSGMPLGGKLFMIFSFWPKERYLIIISFYPKLTAN